jgi:hypothetical protein
MFWISSGQMTDLEALKTQPTFFAHYLPFKKVQKK